MRSIRTGTGIVRVQVTLQDAFFLRYHDNTIYTLSSSIAHTVIQEREHGDQEKESDRTKWSHSERMVHFSPAFFSSGFRLNDPAFTKSQWSVSLSKFYLLIVPRCQTHQTSLTNAVFSSVQCNALTIEILFRSLLWPFPLYCSRPSPSSYLTIVYGGILISNLRGSRIGEYASMKTNTMRNRGWVRGVITGGEERGSFWFEACIWIESRE